MSTQTTTSTSAACPECAADVAPPADLLEGEILACDDCGSELEVTALAPLAFDLAPEVQEDWGE